MPAEEQPFCAVPSGPVRAEPGSLGEAGTSLAVTSSVLSGIKPGERLLGSFVGHFGGWKRGTLGDSAGPDVPVMSAEMTVGTASGPGKF